MPKLIDHDARRVELARAVWRVILRDGVGHVSVRSVASDAGVSTGSLRHMFPSQAELLRFSMQLVATQVRERILALPDGLDPRQRAVAIALELLPLDARRRAEMEVNLALVAQASTDPSLREIRDESHAALRYGCERMLTLLLCVGLVDAALDAELETSRLHALIDGLAAHLTYRAPGADAQWAVAVLHRHLDSLRPIALSS